MDSAKKNNISSKYERRFRRRKMLQQKRSRSKLFSDANLAADFSASVSWQKRAYLFLLILILACIIYFLFFSPVFLIDKISIGRTAKIPATEVENKITDLIDTDNWLIFPYRNLIIFPADKIASSLKNDFQQIETIEINKRFPDVLRVEVVEKKPLAVWVSGGKFYAVAEKGLIAYELPLAAMRVNTLPVVKDSLNKPVKLNDLVLDWKALQMVQELRQKFSERTNIEMHSFSVPASGAQEVHLETKDGFRIYFSTERAADAQLNDLVLALQEKIPVSSRLEYIDLRVPNMIYYR
ncbi:MAG: hypothetical protein ACD_68C00123G0002 [uncultured bacterium]|nr:MAG: hypothetical protein ACD_68C00123G0002 [uncultured bacterium]